jgi:hypothetical protein
MFVCFLHPGNGYVPGLSRSPPVEILAAIEFGSKYCNPSECKILTIVPENHNILGPLAYIDFFTKSVNAVNILSADNKATIDLYCPVCRFSEILIRAPK